MSLSLTFIGNATVLLRGGPFTILTDPNFLHAGQRAHLGYGLLTKRLPSPALQVGELPPPAGRPPPLDAVVFSHLHGDHWDKVASEGLDKWLPILTTTHAAPRLREK